MVKILRRASTDPRALGAGYVAEAQAKAGNKPLSRFIMHGLDKPGVLYYSLELREIYTHRHHSQKNDPGLPIRLKSRVDVIRGNSRC